MWVYCEPDGDGDTAAFNIIEDGAFIVVIQPRGKSGSVTRASIVERDEAVKVARAILDQAGEDHIHVNPVSE